jgi:hypothetical protein
VLCSLLSLFSSSSSPLAKLKVRRKLEGTDCDSLSLWLESDDGVVPLPPRRGHRGGPALLFFCFDDY